LTDKNGWGGPRKGAGRPSVKKPMPGYMRTVTRKRDQPEDPILKQAGVKILNHEKVSAYAYRPRILQTDYQAAKAQYSPRGTLSTGWGNIAYEGMNNFYKEYRRNWLVRRGINVLAFWVTKEGFDTELELTKPPKDMTDEQEQSLLTPYEGLKDYVDDINKIVNADEAWRIATIKRPIYGHVAFEIDGGITNPKRLISLDSAQIQPLIDNTWTLKGYSYQGKGSLTQPFYSPDEVLYFTLNDLEGDLQGLSDVEPILTACELHDKIVREDLTEALTIIWAGIALYLFDRNKMPNVTDQTVQTIIDNFVDQIKPGKSIVAENVWSATVVDIKPDLEKMLSVLDAQERAIAGGLGVPRDMLALKTEGWSRANAYADLEMFVDGAVADAQRTLKRQIEAQWYEPLIRSRLGFQQGKYKLIKIGSQYRLYKNPRFRGAELPVSLKHVWREPRTADWYELLKSVSIAYNGGAGWISTEKAWEVMMKGKSADFSQEAYDQAHQLSIIDQPIPPAQPVTPPTTQDENPMTLEVTPPPKDNPQATDYRWVTKLHEDGHSYRFPIKHKKGEAE